MQKFGSYKQLSTFVRSIRHNTKHNIMKAKTENKTFTFNESVNIQWCILWLPTSKEWMMWCEKNGSLVWGTREFRKKLNSDIKKMFGIK